MIDECFGVIEPLLGTKAACAAVGRPRATHYRTLRPSRVTARRPRPGPPNKLSEAEVCDVLGVFWGDFVRREPARHQANVKELMALYASGKIRPYVSEHFPLERASESIDWLSARKAMGKVVVTMG